MSKDPFSKLQSSLSLEDFPGKNSDFKGIWGVKNTEVYVAGSSGTVLLFDGFKWKNN
jgi:hypothetical protein